MAVPTQTITKSDITSLMIKFLFVVRPSHPRTSQIFLGYRLVLPRWTMRGNLWPNYTTPFFHSIKARSDGSNPWVLHRAPFPPRKVQQSEFWSKGWAKRPMRRLIHSLSYKNKNSTMLNSWVVTNFRAWFQLGRIDRYPIFSQVFFKNFWYLFIKLLWSFIKWFVYVLFLTS